MFSYSDILKNAYHLTKRFPLLWLLGMFLLGSFNLNYLHVRGVLPEIHWARYDSLSGALWFLRDHPTALGLASLSILVLATVSLVLTNWSKILLLLVGKSCAETKYYNLGDEFKKTKLLLWPVIKVSVLTSLFLLAALLVLAAPILVEEPLLQVVLWMIGGAIFFLVVFTISSLNIFTTMFMVLLGLPIKKALNAATDFFVANIGALLGLVAVLLVIYLAGAALGLGFLGLIKVLVRFAQAFSDSGGLQVPAVFIIIKAVGVLILWVWLGMLNAFLNISLLLFFLKKITPVKGEDAKAASDAVPAPAIP